jgi:hypothetical protein
LKLIQRRTAVISSLKKKAYYAYYLSGKVYTLKINPTRNACWIYSNMQILKN